MNKLLALMSIRRFFLFRFWRLTDHPVGVRIYMRALHNPALEIDLGSPLAQFLWNTQAQRTAWHAMTADEQAYARYLGLDTVHP